MEWQLIWCYRSVFLGVNGKCLDVSPIKFLASNQDAELSHLGHKATVCAYLGPQLIPIPINCRSVPPAQWVVVSLPQRVGWKIPPKIFWADSRNSRMNEYLQISNIYNYNLFLNMNKSMVLCQKEIRPPKKNPTKMCQTPFFRTSACAAASACALAKASSSALRRICRHVAVAWLVVGWWLKTGTFWNRKGGTREAQFHQEFQVPKMEVLNLVRLFWGGFSLT